MNRRVLFGTLFAPLLASRTSDAKNYDGETCPTCNGKDYRRRGLLTDKTSIDWHTSMVVYVNICRNCGVIWKA